MNIKEVFNSLIKSFDKTGDGFSGRKLSAFIAIITAVVLSYTYCYKEIIVELTMVWLGFALLCLGIVTVQQLVEFKTGNKQTTIPTQP